MALFIVLTATLSVLSLSMTLSPSLPSVYHALHCLAFVVLFVLLAAKPMQDGHLGRICHAILAASAIFAVVNMPVDWSFSSSGGRHRVFAEAEGVWQVLLVVFLLYGMLPLKTAVAFCAGVALPTAHLAVTAAVTANHLPDGWKWQQVCKPWRLLDVSHAKVSLLIFFS